MALSAQQVADKWSKNLSMATDSIKAGVNSVMVAPGEAAARNQQGYTAGVMENADKWARNVRKVSLDDWRNATLGIGLQRLQSGTQKGKGKMQTFMDSWIPHTQQLQARIAAMPKGSLEASIARAAEAIRFNKGYKGNS